jgi:hypothetical protein
MLLLTGTYLRNGQFEFGSGYVRSGPPGPNDTAKWMTLPSQSGNMSLLYCRYNRGFTRLALRYLLDFVDGEAGRCDDCRVDIVI